MPVVLMSTSGPISSWREDGLTVFPQEFFKLQFVLLHQDRSDSIKGKEGTSLLVP